MEGDFSYKINKILENPVTEPTANKMIVQMRANARILLDRWLALSPEAQQSLPEQWVIYRGGRRGPDPESPTLDQMLLGVACVADRPEVVRGILEKDPEAAQRTVYFPMTALLYPGSNPPDAGTFESGGRNAFEFATGHCAKEVLEVVLSTPGVSISLPELQKAMDSTLRVSDHRADAKAVADILVRYGAQKSAVSPEGVENLRQSLGVLPDETIAALLTDIQSELLARLQKKRNNAPHAPDAKVSSSPGT